MSAEIMMRPIREPLGNSGEELQIESFIKID